MAIYQTKRYLIDSYNGLEIPLGHYVETECELWVRRFGDDLRLTDVDLTGSGYIIRKLVGLKEELMTPTPTKLPEVVLPAVVSVEPPAKKVIRKKTTP